jgi:hypothetical protein
MGVCILSDPTAESTELLVSILIVFQPVSCLAAHLKFNRAIMDVPDAFIASGNHVVRPPKSELVAYQIRAPALIGQPQPWRTCLCAVRTSSQAKSLLAGWHF